MKILDNAWSVDDTYQLRQLWLTDLTYAQIAQKLGKTKNQISGKIFRLQQSKDIGRRKVTPEKRNSP